MFRQVSLRFRLAFVSALAVLLVMSGAAVLQYYVAVRGDMAAVDRRLQDMLNSTPAIVSADSIYAWWRANGLIDDSSVGPSIEAASGYDPTQLRMLDAQGRPTDRSPITNQPLPKVLSANIPVAPEMRTEAQTPGNDVLYVANADGTELLVRGRCYPPPLPLPMIGSGVAIGGNGYCMLAARSVDQLIESRRRLAAFLVVEVVLAFVTAGVLGYVVTRSTMRPVDRLARAAEEIAETEDLARRVDPRGADRDFADLVTTFNRMLERLQAGYQRLAAALANEKRFVADASHELRTPLTTISGNIDYLARTGADPDVIADMRNATDRLTRMVANLTQLAREEAGAADPRRLIDFDVLVAEICSEPDYAGAEVHADVTEGLWVEGSEGSIASAVRNLVGNAVKYGGGQVWVRALRDGDAVVLDVRDDGPGVAADEVDRVFERFWRSADAKGAPGSGLGLSIVRSAIQAHGGSVCAFPGPGGHFEVRLPAAASPAPDSGDELAAPTTHGDEAVPPPPGRSAVAPRS